MSETFPWKNVTLLLGQVVEWLGKGIWDWWTGFSLLSFVPLPSGYWRFWGHQGEWLSMSVILIALSAVSTTNIYMFGEHNTRSLCEYPDDSWRQHLIETHQPSFSSLMPTLFSSLSFIPDPVPSYTMTFSSVFTIPLFPFCPTSVALALNESMPGLKSRKCCYFLPIYPAKPTRIISLKCHFLLVPLILHQQRFCLWGGVHIP